MYLCSAAFGYSRWKFKCIGFVLNGIDYCAVLVKGKRWTIYPSTHPPTPPPPFSLSVSVFRGQQQQQAFLWIRWRVSAASWTLSSASALVLLSYDHLRISGGEIQKVLGYTGIFRDLQMEISILHHSLMLISPTHVSSFHTLKSLDNEYKENKEKKLVLNTSALENDRK